MDEQNENTEQAQPEAPEQKQEEKEKKPTAPSTEALAPEHPESKTEESPTSTQYASFIERLLAILIDAIILGFVIGIIFTIFQSLIPKALANQYFLGFNPVITLLTWVYFVYMDIKYGATLGKRAMHLRVQNLDSSENLTTIDAILRETIGRMISALIFGLGYLWMIWDPKKQCWHDKLGKSVVVKVKK